MARKIIENLNNKQKYVKLDPISLKLNDSGQLICVHCGVVLVIVENRLLHNI